MPSPAKPSSIIAHIESSGTSCVTPTTCPAALMLSPKPNRLSGRPPRLMTWPPLPHVHMLTCHHRVRRPRWPSCSAASAALRSDVIRAGLSEKRLKSFCVAKPMQKLRWAERGWSRDVMSHLPSTATVVNNAPPTRASSLCPMPRANDCRHMC